MNQYKYISKPYTLDELVNGNPIFKIYCDFFNDLYEWEQSQEIQQINQLELDYINTEHLELVFNEFLNILSLLIYDKVSYNETLKKVTLKSKELENFYLLKYIIPDLLENIKLLNSPKITEKTRSYLHKTYGCSLGIELDNSLLNIATKHIENLNNTLTEENINDLTNFFDIPKMEYFNELISNYPFKHKNKEKNQYFKDLNNKLNPIIESSSEEVEDINNINIDEKNLKTPIAIAMLNEIGFFKLDSLKSLSDSRIAQIISIIQEKDPNNMTLNRKISGNIRVLKPNRKEDGLRYTSHKLSEKVKKILNEIK